MTYAEKKARFLVKVLHFCHILCIFASVKALVHEERCIISGFAADGGGAGDSAAGGAEQAAPLQEDGAGWELERHHVVRR